MNLFVKIFLWFLAAITLMIGIVVFLNWTTQEPTGSRWQNSVRNQMNIYAGTAAQIQEKEGEAGLAAFLERLRSADTISEIDLARRDGTARYSDVGPLDAYRELIGRTFASGNTELELSDVNTALAAKSFRLSNGEELALVIRWERPRPMPLFGESGLRYLRYVALLLAAIILCYALARYLVSPIGKIRKATQKLAGGDLKTRVADEFPTRHDEIGALAADFDVMAERIEMLITSQKRLTQDISHELRSPLARMNLALEIAKQKSNPDAQPLLERIENESVRLNEMIGRMLTLSRLESGSSEIESEDVDLTELVEDVVADAEFEARAKHKSVKLEAEGCNIRGNESLLRSAIENVLRNAVRYTDENTSVNVTLLKKNGNAVVTVSDSGGGVPEEELANLFRPFYRVGEARERKTGGIGLGLAIAERAIQAHGGTITARNENGGLSVEITLKCQN
jgi:two-component system sensor histidine kinase CpxA